MESFSQHVRLRRAKRTERVSETFCPLGQRLLVNVVEEAVESVLATAPWRKSWPGPALEWEAVGAVGGCVLAGLCANRQFRISMVEATSANVLLVAIFVKTV